MEPSIEHRLDLLEHHTRFNRIVIAALVRNCPNREALRRDLLHTLEQLTVNGLNSNRISDQALEALENDIHRLVREDLQSRQ